MPTIEVVRNKYRISTLVSKFNPNHSHTTGEFTSGGGGEGMGVRGGKGAMRGPAKGPGGGAKPKVSMSVAERKAIAGLNEAGKKAYLNERAAGASHEDALHWGKVDHNHFIKQQAKAKPEPKPQPSKAQIDRAKKRANLPTAAEHAVADRQLRRGSVAHDAYLTARYHGSNHVDAMVAAHAASSARPTHAQEQASRAAAGKRAAQARAATSRAPAKPATVPKASPASPAQLMSEALSHARARNAASRAQARATIKPTDVNELRAVAGKTSVKRIGGKGLGRVYQNYRMRDGLSHADAMKKLKAAIKREETYRKTGKFS